MLVDELPLLGIFVQHAANGVRVQEIAVLAAVEDQPVPSEVEHVLATQCLLAQKMKNMQVRVEGKLGTGVTAKDITLAVIGATGTAGGTVARSAFTVFCATSSTLAVVPDFCPGTTMLGFSRVASRTTRSLTTTRPRTDSPPGSAPTRRTRRGR